MTLNEEALMAAINAARDTVEIEEAYTDYYDSGSNPYVENWGETLTAAITAYINTLEEVNG